MHAPKISDPAEIKLSESIDKGVNKIGRRCEEEARINHSMNHSHQSVNKVIF